MRKFSGFLQPIRHLSVEATLLKYLWYLGVSREDLFGMRKSFGFLQPIRHLSGEANLFKISRVSREDIPGIRKFSGFLKPIRHLSGETTLAASPCLEIIYEDAYMKTYI